jgi:hypothetical protein
MEKNKKMLLIGGGIAALGIITYLIVSNKNKTTSNTSVLTSVGNCPAGQVPCSNNKSKCYNPSLTYVIDPCATITNTKQTNTNTNTTLNPIAEIVDGLFNLFKKKPATT